MEAILESQPEFSGCQINLLKKVAPYLSEHLKERTLNKALNIHDDTKKPEVLIELFPYLTDLFKIQVYNELVKTQNKENLAQSLTQIAPFLPNQIKQEALRCAIQAISTLKDDWQIKEGV